MPHGFTFIRNDIVVEKSQRFLPHWEQPDVCYFLTFRTADSIPAGILSEWKCERDAWLRAHGIDPNLDDWHARIGDLPEKECAIYHGRFSGRMQEFLDDCHGECLLRRAELRTIVAGALHHFDGGRYRLGGFVVMPNHVHILVQLIGETRLKGLSFSWKHFTAREINKLLGGKRHTHFWQAETYDHIVRSEAQFHHYRRYIAENPQKARLREGEASVYLAELEEK
jgi:putative transposase